MQQTAKLELDAALVAEAEALDVDVSRELESYLRRLVEKRRIARAWEEEHREAIEEFNRYIEKYGTIGEQYRRYG